MPESRSFPRPSNVPSPQRPERHRPFLAAALGAAGLFIEPAIASAQSDSHHRPRHEQSARRHHHERDGRRIDLRREARRSRWTEADEENFQFLAELISYDHLQTGRAAHIPAPQFDEDVRLLRRRILHLIQQGQEQRSSPGLLTLDMTNHDNEDGTTRPDNILDGALAHQDIASLARFLELQRDRVLSGHYVTGYYEVARYAGNQELTFWNQVALLDSNNPADRTDFETAGEEMGQMSFDTRHLGRADNERRGLEQTGEGVGTTPAEALSRALWTMMFRPVNEGTGRYASDGRRVLRIQFEDISASFTDVHITSARQQNSDGSWHITIAGIELRPPRSRTRE